MRQVSTPPFVEIPAGTERRELAVPGGPLAALWAPAAGVPRGTVVFVPGFTGSKEDFIAVLAPLQQRGWSVLAYDQRGQYESPGPDDESAYTVDALGTDLLTVVAELGAGPVHAVGHSFGGLVLRTAATRSPQAFASVTLLCSGPTGLPADQHGPLRRLHGALPTTPLAVIGAIREERDRAAGWVPPSAAVEQFCRDRFVANNPWSLRALADQLVTTTDSTAALAATLGAVPVHVVYGDGDDVWPTAQQDQMARVLGVTPVVIAGCGHSPTAELPDTTAATLDQLWSRSAQDGPATAGPVQDGPATAGAPAPDEQV